MERLQRIRHFLNREVPRNQMSARLKTLLGDDAIYSQTLYGPRVKMSEEQRIQEIYRIIAISRL